MKNIYNFFIVGFLAFLFVGLVVMFTTAMDKEFLISYSKSTGIPVDKMRIIDSGSCEPEEQFVEKYGLCIR